MTPNDSSILYDVIVIGCGPAGSSAAYFLASQKANVLVLEKATLPRYKTCGGGVVNRVKNILPINFDQVSEINCNKAEIYDNKNNLRFITRRDTPTIFMTMRQDLDYHILKEAKVLGAKVRDNTEVINIKSHPDYVEIITKELNFKAKFVILSNGATGIGSDKIGIKTSTIKLPALEYEVYVEKDDYDRFKNYARFDFDIASHGYGWVFPKKDHLSIGVVIIKKKEKDLNYIMNEYFNLLNIKNIIKYERHGYFIPLNSGSYKFAKGRILLAGDAAGFADPVTGEGISHAVESGKIAAEIIVKNEYDKNRVADLYTNRINHTIIQEIKYAKVIAALVYTFPNVRKILFKLYGQKLSELMTDIFTGDNTYSQLLTDPANYFKLLKYLFPKRIKKDRVGKKFGKNTQMSHSA